MKKLRTIDVYTIPLFFVALAAVILRSVALLTSFDTISMHFENKTAIVIGGVVVIVSIIAFLSYLIFGEKESELIARSDNAASYIPAGIVGIALLFIGAQLLSGCFSDEVVYHGITLVLAILSGVLAIASIVPFFLSVFIEKRNDLYKAAFSLCIVFFLAVYAMLLYFNKQQHPTNSPNRFVDQMAYLFAAIFFLYESRIPLGRAKWRGYIAFGLSASLLCAYSSIPSIILYFARSYTLSESLSENILTLTLMIFIGSKVLQFRNLTPDTECEAARSIANLAAMREEEIKSHRNSSRAQDINNMEENDDTVDAENYSIEIITPESTTDFNSENP
ncbi:MAG: hypothetical protein IJX58_06565 [Clostridia bacterium]|nr:hypothetical protein [Clostridia bacterium]